MSHRNNQGAVIATILNTMSSKEGEYRQGVKQNHQLSKSIGERLAKDGPLEEILMALNNNKGGGEEIVPPGEIKSFLSEQQGRLKALAERNSLRNEKIGFFLGAINQLQQGFETDNAHDQDVDYSSNIENFMKGEIQQMESSNRDLQGSKFCKEIRATLGENEGTAGEDDIEVVRNNEENIGNYKCCITAQWMEDPVTSTTCQHSYSRKGILSYIRSKGGQCPCPFPGCSQIVTQNVLEDDAGMARKVKRNRRRVEAEEEQKKQSQALDMDEDDED
ncbi:Zinc-finger of the MIZ type in Nse subunit [Seminavis robusta]|uniref:Zinc-finger of the MIZ type in Nse subunit n=1 Tax=Seminavis robusta TaxID=568900 RepID=A0A9N8E9I3_9STRA|nr:Zinc-finger of the MIZ type in Nse subunit [Seminavis robusta]|eukprot:Sro657_g182610.1 Zinc-finger of the MIZ type in Nse subunit (276) ;mRNA; f:51923-52750